MADITTTAYTLAGGVLTGLITAAFSVRMALKRFRAERLWEHKVTAYSEVLDALYDVHKSARIHVNEVEDGATYVEEYRKQASERATVGFDAIRRAAAKGTFLVGPEAAAKLDEIAAAFDEPRHNENWYDEVVADLHAAEKAIAELRTIANADLRRV